MTISGVKNNLWRRQQSGLYAPMRRNFPIDGLALYLPLWHPELSGSAIISKDLNAHTCTVTGAVWGLQGRYFDGSDDKIAVGTADGALNITGNQITLMGWYKDTGEAAKSWVLGKMGASLGSYGLVMRDPSVAAGRVTEIGLDVGTGWASYFAPGVNPFSTGVFNFLAGTYDGANVRAYNNALLSSTTARTGNIVSRAHVAYVGWESGWNSNWAKGIIGDVWVYNRALTLLEIQQIYNATKWRYS